MSISKKALRIPAPARQDKNAIELLRVWAANGKQYTVLDVDVWDDPAAWGICLVDLAKHIANAYAQHKEMDYASALARIKEGFDVEWAHPSDEPPEAEE